MKSESGFCLARASQPFEDIETAITELLHLQNFEDLFIGPFKNI